MASTPVQIRPPKYRHTRKSFFKYMSATTAQAVLMNGALRASDPALFNDPFDIPRELVFGVSERDIIEAIGQELEQLIQSPPQNTSGFSPQVKFILDAIRICATEEDRAELIRGVRENARTHNPVSQGLNETREMWRAWRPDLRILCVSEEHLDEAMWDRYADQAKGIVLEFNCDSPTSFWQEARKVEYHPVEPMANTAQGWARYLMMPPDKAIYEMFFSATLTKKPNWMTEKEWRVVTFKKTNETGQYSDFGFAPSDLSAVYFGHNMPAPHRMLLLAILSKYPHAKAYQLSLGNRDFIVNQIRG
jgi:hypothetical protein